VQTGSPSPQALSPETGEKGGQDRHPSGLVTTFSTRGRSEDHVHQGISRRRTNRLYVGRGTTLAPPQPWSPRGLGAGRVRMRPVHDRCEEIPYEERPTWSRSVSRLRARRAYEIAAEYRARGVTVNTGRRHPPLFAEECHPMRTGISGEARFRWAEVVVTSARPAKPVYNAKVAWAQPGGVQRGANPSRARDTCPIT